MARYKPYDLKQGQLIAISFDEQILPGSFEHTLNELIEENDLDLSVFEERYCNDEKGCRAYDPKVLLKVILFGYYKKLISSRDIADACQHNVVFMALSANTRPHFTTIAGFVSGMKNEVMGLFRDVLTICEELELIGKDHFAVDGCKLPSNASKRWSGTHEELKEKQEKYEKVVKELVRRHRERDAEEKKGKAAERDLKKIQTLRENISKIKGFLATGEKKIGPTGKEHKSNITDPESAKMTTSHGVIQGYNGVAMVDGKHQIVVAAEVWGSGQEEHLLMPMVEQTRENFRAIESSDDVFEKTKLIADSGFHNAKSVEDIEKSGVDAYIADQDYRKRDPAFADRGRYKERHRKERRLLNKTSERQRFLPKDFIYDEQNQTCICPAGKKLYKSGQNLVIDGRRAAAFTAPKSACRSCDLRNRCLRYPERTVQRQVVFFKERIAERKVPERAMDRMKRKIDTPEGRAIYAMRIAIVEPVFGNTVENKRMDHFTLRGRPKAGIQWKLFTMVHNIEKIARYGKAA